MDKKRKSYVDPNFDQSASFSNLPPTDRYKGLIEPSITPGAGERQVPGQDEWRLADTPQAWVYIQKKQWVDDTWTYIVADSEVTQILDELETKREESGRLQMQIDVIRRIRGPETERAAAAGVASGTFFGALAGFATAATSQEGQLRIKKAAIDVEIKSLETRLEKARQKARQSGGQDRTDGKLKQIDIRSALGNIITRKIDWMSDFEKFTKVPSAVHNTAARADLAARRRSVYQQLLRLAQELTEVTLDKEIVGDEKKKAEMQKRGDDIAEQFLSLTGTTTEYDMDPLVVEDAAPITASGNAFTRYYKAAVTKTKNTQEVEKLKADLEKQQEQLEKVAEEVINTARNESNPTAVQINKEDVDRLVLIQKGYAQIRQEINRLQRALDEATAGAPIMLDGSSQPVFNGVLELANVSSVSTTVTLEGEGSATVTLENPQNVFYISREDIALALSSDPFLAKDDLSKLAIDQNQGQLVYYKGAYFPAHIVRMLQNSPGSFVDTRHLSQATAQARIEGVEALSRLLKEKEAELEFIEKQIESEEIERDLVAKQITKLEVDIADLEKKLETARDILKNDDPTATNQEDLSNARQILLRYYQGKTIFEVLDRIYIWTTSPTRTPFRLRGTTRFAIEDPSVLTTAQQRSAAQISLDATQEEYDRFKDWSEIWLGENDKSEFRDTTPGIYEVPIEFRKFSGVNRINGSIAWLGDAFAVSIAAKAQIKQYLTNLEAELSQLEAIVAYFDQQLVSISAYSASRVSDRLSKKESTGRFSETEYESAWLGLEEQKVQVFQGVVSSVKRTYSDGQYKITLSCRDNLAFLDMSRIMKRPALNIDKDPIGILEDPIWRNGKRAGTWKDGTLALHHEFFGDEIQARIRKKLRVTEKERGDTGTTGETEGRLRFSPLVITEAFAGIDAANVISFLVTGIPYNPVNFIRAAAFGDRITKEEIKSGKTDQRYEGATNYFNQLKRLIGDENARLGNFKPFLDLEEGVYRKEDIDERLTEYQELYTAKLDTLAIVYKTYVILRASAFKKAFQSRSKTGQIPTVAKQIYCNEAGALAEKENIEKNEKSTTQQKTTEFITKLVEAVQAMTEVRSGAKITTKSTEEENKKAAGQKAKREAAQAKASNKPGSGETAKNKTKEATAKDEAAKDDAKAKDKGSSLPSGYGILSEWGAKINSKLPTGEMPIAVGSREELLHTLASMTVSDGLIGQVVKSIYDIVGSDIPSNLVLEYLKSGTFGELAKKAEGGNVPIAKVQNIIQLLETFLKDLLTVDALFETELQAAISAGMKVAEFTSLSAEFINFLGGLESKKRAESEKDGKAGRLEPVHVNPLTSLPEKIIRKTKPNYLVVSDRYALDLDLQAYVRMVGGDRDLWQSEFESALSVCRRAAEQIDFEFYADEDGHIRFKPPTYNRILKEHFEAISESDAPVRDALLIRYGFESGLVLKAMLQANSAVDKALSEYSHKLSEVEQFLLINKIKTNDQTALVDIRAQYLGVSQMPTTAVETSPAPSDESGCIATIQQHVSATKSAAEEVNQRLKELQFFEKQKLIDITTLNPIPNNADTDIQFKATIARQEATKALYTAIVEAIQKLKEDVSETLETTRKEATSAVRQLPSFFDENRIHRLANHDIISSDFTEAPPRFTRLDLVGSPDLVQIETGGKTPAYYWSGAVDYDMWRNYGFMFEQRQKAYFHSGREALTYARTLLGQERGRVLTGNVTLRGDAKYRVGDCVFIEDEGLYYYIVSVSHSLSYGSSYTTSLTLSYGRRIGEIIPHPFDALGGIMLDAYQNELEDLLLQEQILKDKEQNTTQ